jgi:histidinol-phosphatase
VSNADDLRFAHELADAADAITLARFRSLDLRVERKPDLTPVSDADRAAEYAVRDLVEHRRAGEAILGEELGDGGGDATAAARWIVDPIDGTRNFVRGIPVWATLIALERDGETEVAVVSAPALGHRWWAVRGGGAWSDGTRVRVSSIRRLEDAVTSTTSTAAMAAGWSIVAARAWADRGFGDFWQYCLLAEGAVDVATDAELELWDYAAVRLLVEEAGGRCSTFAGAAPAVRMSFLATNGLLHDEIVGLLQPDRPGLTP